MVWLNVATAPRRTTDRDEAVSHQPGDLYLELHVALPAAATPAQQQAYRALAQAFPDFKPRATQGAQGG